jgi:cysteine desulfurase NifS
MHPIYLDYNATTPIDKKVADAMIPYITTHFGNPSSTHEYGLIAHEAVSKARKQVASLINCKPSEIVFTSGGTESNNFALKGVAYANRGRGNHIITSKVEHPAIIEVCKYLEKDDFKVTYLPVDEYGMVSPEELEAAITDQTILITIMHANNEVGTIQPIREIGQIATKYNIPFHSDAAQSLGKISVDVNLLKVNLLSIAGHKLYAPKGIGALYIKEGTKLEKLIHGADHEMNYRAGTENVILMVGLGKACELAAKDLWANSAHLKKMRDLLYELLVNKCKNVKLNGHPKKSLPNTLSLSFKNIEATTMLGEIHEVAASAGAACHTDSIEVSSVLQAMNVTEDFAMGTIRFSTGKYTTIQEIEKASGIIAEAWERLQQRI